MASTYDDNWRPSARDMHLINTGRKPAWAKKVTEIGPREKRPRTSNAPSEIAMRRVTEPDYHPPFSETDLKNVRKGETMMNQRIADAIARKVDLKVDANADGISVADLSKTPVRFFIWSHGLDYVVKIIRSATDHDAIRCKSIKDVVDVINKNTIGEAMNVNKAKQILEQAGYVIENPQINEADDYSVHGEFSDEMSIILDEFNDLALEKKNDDSYHTLCKANMDGDAISIAVYQKNSTEDWDYNILNLAFEHGQFLLYDPEDDHIIEYYDPNDDFVDQVFRDIDNFF